MRTRGVVSRWGSWVICVVGLGIAGQARAAITNAVFASTSTQQQNTPVTGNGTFTATATSPGELATGQAVVGDTGLTATLTVNNNGLLLAGPAPGQEPIQPITETDSALVSLILSPLVNTSYHLGGSFTVTGFVAGSDPVPGAINVSATITSEYKASLVDEAVGTIFSEDKTGDTGTLTFDTQDGTLLAGHTYFFTTSASLTLQFNGLVPDPGGSATTNFALGPVGPGGGVTVPLPRGAMGGLALLGAMLMAGRRWRAVWC